MSLVPIDKRIEAMIAKRARETGKEKGEIYGAIVERVLEDTRDSGEIELENYAKSAKAIDEMRRHTTKGEASDPLADVINREMMLEFRERRRGGNRGGSDISMKDMMLLKMMNQPSMTEIMMISQMNQGSKDQGVNPEMKVMMEKYTEEAKENRQMMRELLLGKQSDEKMAMLMARSDENVNKVVEELAGNMTKMQTNYEGIIAYIGKGETAGAGTLENLIANALKTRLVDEAMDAIDRGLFQKKEIVTPTGEFSWKGILDRMMNMGEELIKKMPTKGTKPGLMPVKATGGFYVHPVSGETLTAEQAQAMMKAAQLQSQTPVPAGIPEVPATTPTLTLGPQTAEQKAVVEKKKKKKTGETIDLFMGAGEAKGGKGEPQGDEEY